MERCRATSTRLGAGGRPRGIAITAADGVITLTGFVHTHAVKLAAERTVKRVRGVRAVANDIQVTPGNERNDLEIATDAVHALRTHISVPNQVTVTVRNGFLTLEGTVDWMYQKPAAGSAVMYLPGVKGVTNLIQISPVVSTGHIKAQIEEAFRRNAEVDARDIHVHVEQHGHAVRRRALVGRKTGSRARGVGGPWRTTRCRRDWMR